MPRFVAIFYKTVCNAFGRERRIRQREIDVIAPTQGAALLAAKAQFCARENTSDWSTRADEVVVERRVILPRAARTLRRADAR